MKQIATLSILFLISMNLYCQDDIRNHSLKFGYNFTWYGERQSGEFLSQSLTGKGVYLEYFYRLNPYLAIGPRVFTGMGSHSDDFRGKEIKTINTTNGISLSSRITPLPKVLNNLTIDAGVVYYQINTSFNERYEPRWYYHHVEKLGLSSSVSLDFIKTKRLDVGLRFDILTGYYDGRLKIDSKQMGAVLGVKF